VNTDHLAPRAPSIPPSLAPEQWLVCGGSTPWLDAVRALLSPHGTVPLHPAASWRVKHGLVQVVKPGQLPAAARAALRTGAPVVRVFYEPAAVVDIDHLLDDPARPQGHGHRLRISAADGLDGLALSLQQPEGEAIAHWLRTGRRAFPAIALAGRDSTFSAEAAAALQHWADEFLAHNDPADLDAIYANDDTEDTEDGSLADGAMSNLPDGSLDAETPDLEPQPEPDQNGRLWPELPVHDPDALAWMLSAQPMAASSGGDSQVWRWSGVLDEQLADAAEPDQYWLNAPYPVKPGEENGALQVLVRLNREKWGRRSGLVLELHPHRHLPLLVRLVPEAMRPGELPSDTMSFYGFCDADTKLLVALKKRAAVRLNCAALE